MGGLRTFWDKILARPRYSFRQALAEFSRSLMLIVDLEQLKDNVISKIQEIIQVDRIFIVLLNPESNRFQVAECRGYDPNRVQHISFRPDDRLIQWLKTNETYLMLPENPGAFNFLSPREKTLLQEWNIQVVFPLITMNRITGIVLLGQKLSGEALSHEDLELLTTFLGQAALAFENAYLYQEQKSRLRRLYRADRLATLGQLAAGAAHEIRNPLTSIRSTIQYLQRTIRKQEEREMVSELLEEVDRIEGIIQGLLSFARPREPQVEEIDLEGLLQSTLTLIQSMARKQNVQVKLDFRAKERMIQADPSQLKQVFLNVMMNGLQAMPEGGRLGITVDFYQPDDLRTDTSFYKITIRDTGVGIPEADLERIFDPFFSTKKDGTGLGLSISYGIIQRHGGDIEVESRVDGRERGTTIIIKLPRR